MYYFGANETTAFARYSFFLETGLVFESGYRQFCIEENRRLTPVGRTIEEARRNLSLFRNAPPSPASHGTGTSQPTGAPTNQVILIRTIRHVDDAYLVHPAHKEFGVSLGPVLDKVAVVDYWTKEARLDGLCSQR
ncbi:MAG: Dabb family protein [Phycisphaerae bacterium]|nr:Dabb family protein [Phycisphaerae bacterium]